MFSAKQILSWVPTPKFCHDMKLISDWLRLNIYLRNVTVTMQVVLNHFLSPIISQYFFLVISCNSWKSSLRLVTLSSDLDICIEYTLEHRQTKLTTLIVIGTVIYLLLNFTVSKLAFFFLYYCLHTLVCYINKSDYYDSYSGFLHQ